MYLLAAISENPTSADHANLVIFGFAFVIFVLLVLAIMTWAIGILFKRLDAKADKSAMAAAVAPAAKAAPSQPVMSPNENEHIPFLVTAAVAAIMDGQAHRIVSVKPRGEGWAQEGRRQIFSSHRVR